MSPGQAIPTSTSVSAALALIESMAPDNEVQAALAYLRAGGDPSAVAPIPRFLVVASRVVSWPLVGLITAGLGADELEVGVAPRLHSGRVKGERGRLGGQERGSHRAFSTG